MIKYKKVVYSPNYVYFYRNGYHERTVPNTDSIDKDFAEWKAAEIKKDRKAFKFLSLIVLGLTLIVSGIIFIPAFMAGLMVVSMATVILWAVFTIIRSEIG